MKTRLEKVQHVLWVTLIMNLTVCLSKITLGLVTGITAITSDGFHSLGDSLSNIVGLICTNLAQKKPDRRHAYGYERLEEIATLLVASLIAIACYKVIETGIKHLLTPTPVETNWLVWIVMAGTMIINLATVIYEGGAGRRLQSDLLVADSSETRIDLFVSGSVIISTLVAGKTGWYWLDGVATITIGILMAKMVWKTTVETAKHLADAQVVDPDVVKGIVEEIEGVDFCHAIRSRGKGHSFFLDCHVGVNPKMTIEEAHDVVCHKVKMALRLTFPGLKAANIHLEPANELGFTRGRSTFGDRDLYDDRVTST